MAKEGSISYDETLARRAIQGDKLAEEELVTRYHWLVRSCARPYFLAGGDSEDLIQEGMMGLLRAIREYAPDKGILFRTYAETCVRNRIRSAIRAAGRDKHVPLNQSVSLDPPLDRPDDEGFPQGMTAVQPSPEQLLIDQEARRERLETIKGHLSSLEGEILDLYLQGLSYGEIAARTRRSVKSVDNAVRRIRQKVARQLTIGDFSFG